MKPEPISPEFLRVFRQDADTNGVMTFAHFMNLALYHPDVGYYRRNRPRVGFSPDRDFFTASSSGQIFGELVTAACVTRLVAAQRDPAEHAFVELGAEPETAGVLAGVAHPFTSVRTVRVGERIVLSGDCVVFSNELFDAQPCARSIFCDGRWRELGVKLVNDALIETMLDAPPPHVPSSSVEGYHFDQPLAAASLAAEIAAQSWRGLFLAFDYGKTLRELEEHTPAGTARAYYRHTQSNALLARPGEQDLTCHVCWDWLADALRQHGFAEPALDFQESFFIRNAGDFIAVTSAQEAAGLSQRKRALMQLLHPAHMGQKFQVLHALR